MTRNFLEGVRKKRISYTPRGLLEAWLDLDAARKVYLGTLVGLTISVCILLRDKRGPCPNNNSSSPPSLCSSVLAASMRAMASLESPPTSSSAEEGLSGSLPSLCNYSGLCLLARGYCGRFAISRTFIHGLGKQGSPSLLGKGVCYITPFTLLTIYIAFRERRFGLHLPTRTGGQSKVSTSSLHQPDG